MRCLGFLRGEATSSLHFLFSSRSDCSIPWYHVTSCRVVSYIRYAAMNLCVVLYTHAHRSQMQEVRGSNPRLGGLRVSPLQASGGISTLQSRASGLQSTTQGIPSGPHKKRETVKLWLALLVLRPASKHSSLSFSSRPWGFEFSHACISWEKCWIYCGLTRNPMCLDIMGFETPNLMYCELNV